MRAKYAISAALVKRRLSLYSIGVAATLLIAACGGGSVEQGSDTATPISARQALPTPISANLSPGLGLLAGDIGGAGTIDGVGETARFSLAGSIAIDKEDNLYVADFQLTRSVIRKVTPDGVVTTLSGVASFASAFDQSGNRYLSTVDTIVKVAPDGTTTTLAGLQGSEGFVDGAGSTARFTSNGNIVVDASGNVYVINAKRNCNTKFCTYLGGAIRKITPSGVVTTLAGFISDANESGTTDGTGTAARFTSPYALAIEATGTLYVGDIGGIRKVSSAGVVSTLQLGSTMPGFSVSSIAAAPSGELYVTGNNAVYKITSGGIVTLFAGSPGTYGFNDGVGSDARFYDAAGIAIDRGGNLFVSDRSNQVVRKISPAGGVTTLAGRAAALLPGIVDAKGSLARFVSPQGLAADAAGTIYVADFQNSAIRKIALDGSVTTLGSASGIPGYADGSGVAARFAYPNAIAVDVAGTLYIADQRGDAIRKMTSAGLVTTLVLPRSNSDIRGINAMVLDTEGNLYVTAQNKVLKVTAAGLITTLAGSDAADSTDGPGALARFNAPSGIALDRAGNLLIADTGNATLRKIGLNGVVTTVAGVPAPIKDLQPAVTIDGIGAAARFIVPSAIALDAAGNLYVTDKEAIRKVTPAGAVTTVAGRAYSVGTQLGSLPGNFAGPAGLTYLGGNVFGVSDGNSVLKLAVP